MLGATRPATSEAEIVREDQVMEVVDMKEAVASPELAPQGVGMIRKVQEAV